MNVNADDGNQRPGAPETVEAFRDLARAYTRLAIDTIVEVMCNERTPASARLAAAACLLDRAWGRSTSGMDPEAALDFVSVLQEAVAIRTRRHHQEQADDDVEGDDSGNRDGRRH
ncbi:MAG TPA: hypothetical protein VJR58_32440 [Vineibacter sp.]|nr:hypothetical protein [Vineibacter sp.]